MIIERKVHLQSLQCRRLYQHLKPALNVNFDLNIAFYSMDTHDYGNNEKLSIKKAPL